jgi:hypothetical protein
LWSPWLLQVCPFSISPLASLASLHRLIQNYSGDIVLCMPRLPYFSLVVTLIFNLLLSVAGFAAHVFAALAA